MKTAEKNVHTHTHILLYSSSECNWLIRHCQYAVGVVTMSFLNDILLEYTAITQSHAFLYAFHNETKKKAAQQIMMFI